MPAIDPGISTDVLAQQREAARQITARWRGGAAPDAEAAILQLGGSSVHKSIVLDLAYEEFCLLREQGQQISSDEFIARFPGISLSLRRQICIHDALSVRGVLDPDELPEWPVAGDVISGFLLLEELGRGSFGRVFRASEISLRERQVVVKLARHGLQEAQLLAQVPHAGVVPVYSVATDEEWGLTALCMPFISRATLLDVIEIVHSHGRLPTDAQQIAEAARSVNCDGDSLVLPSRQDAMSTFGTFADSVTVFGYLIAGALRATHARGINHRDLKPSNILVDQFGCPLLIDFNLSSEPMRDVALGGTLPYMAPEQLQAFLDVLQGHAATTQVSESADLYSLGVCLFELLYGVHPFAPIPVDLPSRELAEYLLERQALGPRRVPAAEHRIDSGLRRILSRCLEFDVRRRPQSASELADLLRGSLTFSNRFSRFVRVHPRLKRLSLATAAVMTASGGIWFSVQPGEYEQIAQRADSAMESRQFSVAVTHLSKLLERTPTDHRRLVQRGDACFMAGQVAAALKDFQQAYDRHPTPGTATKIAWCNLELGHHSVAARWYRTVLNEHPDAAVIHNNLGHVLACDSAYSDAIAHFSHAVELDPQLSIAWLNRANAIFQRALRNVQPVPNSALEDFEQYRRGRIGTGESYLLACRICARLAVPDESRFLEYLHQAIQHGVPRTVLASDELLKTMLQRPAAAERLRRAKPDGDITRSRMAIPPLFE